MKALYPGIAYSAVQEKYALTHLSMVLGNVPLSKNTISTFLNNIERNDSKIVSFMRNRASALNGHVCAIDGTVKSDESTVNSLSHYSRKARVKGSKDISVLYAYDIDTLEPVCAKAYAGNVIDTVSYEDFLTENDITSGVIMGDKAFQRAAAEKAFAGHPDLHFLNPLKRSDKRNAKESQPTLYGKIKKISCIHEADMIE